MSAKAVRRMYLKEHRLAVVMSCAVILLGALAGIVLWNSLPAEMVVRFGFRGDPDAHAAKAFVVFGLPMILLAFQLVCIFVAADISSCQRTIPMIILWIVPIASVCITVTLYAYGLGPQPSR